MDIRTSLDGLRNLLGVPAAAVSPSKTGSTATAGGLSSDRATFSSAASEVALTATEADVRTDRVSGIQAALAAGTYNVPASAVASKMVDAMLGNG